jgi:hypothetical protein
LSNIVWADLLAAEKKPPPPPPHEIDIEFDDEGSTDYELRHPAGCDPDACPFVGEIDASGIDAFLISPQEVSEWPWYPETIITGRYWVEHWVTVYRGVDYTEYDAGIKLMYPEEAQKC